MLKSVVKRAPSVNIELNIGFVSEHLHALFHTSRVLFDHIIVQDPSVGIGRGFLQKTVNTDERSYNYSNSIGRWVPGPSGAVKEPFTLDLDTY